MIVLDASVATKLFVAEVGSDAAARVVTRHPLLLAPALIAIEVTSAVARKAHTSDIDRAAAERTLASWQEFLSLGNLQLTPDEAILSDATDHALTIGQPVAACLYLSLAVRHGIALVTADAVFCDAARATGDIRLLGEFGGE